MPGLYDNSVKKRAATKAELLAMDIDEAMVQAILAAQKRHGLSEGEFLGEVEPAKFKIQMQN